MSMDAFVKELLEQMRVVCATTLDAAVDMKPATLSGGVWSATVRLPETGEITIAIDDPGAGALARATSDVAEPSDDDIRAALGEFIGNAIAAAATKVWGRDDITADISAPELIEWPSAAGQGASRFESPGLASPITAMVVLESTAVDQAAAAPRAPIPPAPSEAARLDVLLDIDLPLVVRFGGTHLPLKVLSRLGPGSLIDLSRAPDDPVEMLVGDRVVARGEVVMVSGCYGIRVLEVVGGRDGNRPAVTR